MVMMMNEEAAETGFQVNVESNAQECLSSSILLGVLVLVGKIPGSLDLNSGLFHGIHLAHALYLDPGLSSF